MSRITIRILAVTTALLLGAVPAPAQYGPDTETSIAEFVHHEGPETVVLMVLPNGSGDPLTQALLLGGGTVDGSIEIFLRDWMGVPVANFPWQDVWLTMDAAGGTLATCPSALSCQIRPVPIDSDADGRLVISGGPRAGGYNEGLMQVRVNNVPLESSAGLQVRFVSPDIDGNLTVNLSDAGFFATDLFGAYHFRSDFDADGDIDLSDAGFMATNIGKSCTSG